MLLTDVKVTKLSCSLISASSPKGNYNLKVCKKSTKEQFTIQIKSCVLLQTFHFVSSIIMLTVQRLCKRIHRVNRIPAEMKLSAAMLEIPGTQTKQSIFTFILPSPRIALHPLSHFYHALKIHKMSCGTPCLSWLYPSRPFGALKITKVQKSESHTMQKSKNLKQ